MFNTCTFKCSEACMYTNSFSLFDVCYFPLHGIYHYHSLTSFNGPLLLTDAISVNFITNACGSPTVINVILCL
jgi:hypothetical protein